MNKIIQGIMIGVFALFFIAVMTEMATNGWVSRLITIRADSKYVIPDGYKMRYMPGVDKYVIEKTENDYYTSYRFMSIRISGIYWWKIEDATKFSDSSRCKGALKKYLGERTLAP